jgi:drug/metabolite transporter (DMT)-like permease
MHNQKRAVLTALTAVFFWATVASAFKIALNEMDYYHLLLFSSLSSLAILFLLILIQGKWEDLLKITFRDIQFSALSGLFNPFSYYLILFKSYSLLPAQIAQPLNYTWPIMLVLLSIPFLGQKADRKSLVGLVLCMIGVVLISSGGKTGSIENPLGLFLALFSAVVWGGYWIINMKDKREESLKLFLNFLFGIIYIVLYGLIFTDFSLPSQKGLISAAYVGVFEMGITFFLWSKALKMAESTASISTLAYLSPLLSLLLIALVLKETIALTTVAGLLIIITGILYQKGIITLPGANQHNPL